MTIRYMTCVHSIQMHEYMEPENSVDFETWLQAVDLRIRSGISQLSGFHGYQVGKTVKQ